MTKFELAVKCQTQAEVIIHTNFLDLETPILHDHRKRCLKFFTIYGHVGHLVNVTKNIFLYKFTPPPKEGPRSLALICQCISVKKELENNGHIHVSSPGARADNALGLFSATL